MRSKKHFILILWGIIVLLTGLFLKSNLSYTKLQKNQKIKISAAIDSVRNVTIDSMNVVIDEQKENELLPSKFLTIAKPIELYNLINLFTPDNNLNYELYDWKTEATNKSINWLTSGVEMGEHDYYREGEIIVSINGKVIECLNKTTYPCSWNFILYGVRNGYTSFCLSSVTHQSLSKMNIEELFKGHKFEAKTIKTDEFDNKTYRVTFPQKKPVDITIKWSCGSAGCSMSLICETLEE